MILTGRAIEAAVDQGEIAISPFEPACLGPNSYDFHLGTRCRTYDAPVLDSGRPNPSTVQEVPPEGLVLDPKRIYLWDTWEVIGSNRYVPIIRARSSTARLGLFVHVTADMIDIGSINRLTLQLHAVVPVRVYPRMRVGHVTFWVCSGEIVPYAGKYRDIESPAGSLSYRDFEIGVSPLATTEK